MARKTAAKASTSAGFLPDDYEVPKTASGYLKWEDGDNRFRILAPPILGTQEWTTTEDNKRHCERYPEGETPDQGGDCKHIWILPVFDYGENRVKVMEITQSTIQDAITGYARNPAWGDPLGYDIVVNRSGSGRDNTSYTVTPNPKKALTKGAREIIASTPCDVSVLFHHDPEADPFKVDAPAPKAKRKSARRKR